MEFTVFTSAGGFREFVDNSEYHVGEQNGCLYAVDGKSGQVVTYGPMAWASVQEWRREGAIVPPAGESRRTLDDAEPAISEDVPHELTEDVAPVAADPLQPISVPIDLPPLPRPQHLAMPEATAPPRQFDPLSDPLERFAEG